MPRPIPLLVLLFVLGSANPVAAQKTLRRVKGKPLADPASSFTPTPRPAGRVAASPSGKLVVGGAHTGNLGILEIETDFSLEGPLTIDVSVDGSPIAQRAGDTSGRLELPLTRKKQTSLQIRLGNGTNLIRVADSVNPDEKATLEWVGVDTNPPAFSEKLARPERSNSRITRSASGRLSVTSLHTDEKATFDVVVGNLAGPFTIKVTDETKKVVLEKTRELQRSETSFTETLPLENGPYQITIGSDDAEEKSEMVTLGPWSFKAPETTGTDTTATKDLKPSAKGNLSAAITRVSGAGHLKIHTSDTVKGFKVKVVDANQTEVYSRAFSNLDRGVNDWSLRVAAAKGDNEVTVSSLDDAESIVLSLPAEAAPADEEKSEKTTPKTEEMVEYDWGRVRGYFAAGMVFSKERDDFSHSDMFLDFTLDKNYVAKPWFKIGKGHLFKDLNTFFNARLTSIPITAKDTTEPASGEEEKEECNTPDCEAFITSKKAAMMQAGIYAPMYWDFTTWYRRVPRAGDPSGRVEKNALFIAPLAKGGILTVTGDRETAEAKQFGQDDVFNFYSFGAMLGHFRLHTLKDSTENNPNISPELISWLTLSVGRWENFEIEVPTGDKDALGNDINVRRRPWRVEALGRLKIPETPFIIGFDGNFGKGPDDVRFLFGTRFDIGKIMRTLKLAAAKDEMGGQAPGTSAAPAKPAAAPADDKKP